MILPSDSITIVRGCFKLMHPGLALPRLENNGQPVFIEHWTEVPFFCLSCPGPEVCRTWTPHLYIAAEPHRLPPECPPYVLYFPMEDAAVGIREIRVAILAFVMAHRSAATASFVRHVVDYTLAAAQQAQADTTLPLPLGGGFAA